jgi:hypothetical protein
MDAVSPQVRLFAVVALLAGVAVAGGMLFLSRAQAGAAEIVVRPPVAAPKAADAPAPRNPVVAENGLPRVVAAKLRRHRVVVVAVYARGAALDVVARDEAEAGAGDAGVGFAAVNVADRRLARALAERAQVLAAPSVLVFGKDGQVRARLDGFGDRQLVAELAESAR